MMDTIVVVIELVVTYVVGGVEYMTISYDTLEDCLRRGQLFFEADVTPMFTYECQVTFIEGIMI